MGVTLSLVICAVCLALILISYFRFRDTFHPALFIGPMFLFLYGYLPINLETNDTLIAYLSQDQFEFAQWVNLAGVVAVALGLIAGSGRIKPGRAPELTVDERDRVTMGALIIGAVGVLGFIFSIVVVGGFAAAYGRSYGGGYADSGYIRELFLLPLPALILLLLMRRGPSPRYFRWATIVALMGPLATHGILGTRRGPTFMLASTLVLTLY
jgi:hypothetical protein